jgi:uncharacterized membrane protein
MAYSRRHWTSSCIATTLLPSIEGHKGSVLALLGGVEGELSTVVLSFAISAIYWISQQQRLAMTTFVRSRETWLHLVFLFRIVLIPITTSLPGLTGPHAEWDSVFIYGAHLTLIAFVKLLLWMEVRRTVAAHLNLVRSSIVLGINALALVVGAARPGLAIYFWFSILGVRRLALHLTRRL